MKNDRSVRTLPCPVRAAASRSPKAPALEAPDRTITFAKLDRLVSSTAHRLEARGIGAGDRIAIRATNGWELVVLILGCIRAGAVACPLNTRYPASAAGRLAARAGARRLVVDSSSADPAGGAGPIHPKHAERTFGTPHDTISLDDLVSDPDSERPADGSAGADGGTSAEWPETRLPADRAATIVFTSGSTGEPRAALHTIGNHHFSALGSNQNIPVGQGDRWLLSLPLYHVGGLGILFRCLLGGATVVIPQDGGGVSEGVFRTTHVSMVATQLQRLLDQAELPNLRALLLGGSAIPPGLIDGALARGLPIHTSYGMTEMTSQVATTPPVSDLRRRFGDDMRAVRDVLRTSGRVLSYRALTIRADGEILVGGQTRFAGYVTETGLERPFDADGWFATGDIGELDEGGWLRVVGRRDNLFISGGENIVPEAIEAVLSAGAGVRQAVVVPVPDAEFGFRPVAFVQTEGDVLDPARLNRIIEAELPRYMLPLEYFPWPDDQSAPMKVDRNALRRRAETLIGR